MVYPPKRNATESVRSVMEATVTCSGMNRTSYSHDLLILAELLNSKSNRFVVRGIKSVILIRFELAKSDCP